MESLHTQHIDHIQYILSPVFSHIFSYFFSYNILAKTLYNGGVGFGSNRSHY